VENDQQQALEALIGALPLHAEEGDFWKPVSEAELCEQLSQVGYPAPELLLGWVRRLFDALCLLDRHQLAEGHWKFMSFPASLVGRSLLETLACPGQTLFDAHYWEQGSHRPESDVEEQRRILDGTGIAKEAASPDRICTPHTHRARCMGGSTPQGQISPPPPRGPVTIRRTRLRAARWSAQSLGCPIRCSAATGRFAT
jgi:hypothetical protein